MTTILTVGMNDCVVSRNPDAVLTTHALGSCVGIIIYDPVVQVGGLLHYMLPDSTLDTSRRNTSPFMYADTGIPRMFHAAYHAGAHKDRLLVTVLGGARIIASGGSFDIGKQNLAAMHTILSRAGVIVQHAEVGGTLPRTARIEIATGRILVSFGREQHEILQKVPERRRASDLQPSS